MTFCLRQKALFQRTFYLSTTIRRYTIWLILVSLSTAISLLYPIDSYCFFADTQKKREFNKMQRYWNFENWNNTDSINKGIVFNKVKLCTEVFNCTGFTYSWQVFPIYLQRLLYMVQALRIIFFWRICFLLLHPVLYSLLVLLHCLLYCSLEELRAHFGAL